MVTIGELKRMAELYNLPDSMPIRITVNGTVFEAESISWNRAIGEKDFSVKIRVYVKQGEI